MRFRLWAPAQENVSVVVEKPGGALVARMTREEGGWFDLVLADTGAGTRYRYQLGDGLLVPDPASRFQPGDVHGPSQVIDPEHYLWRNSAWHGRPWEETVLYELHTGCFSPEGTFDGVRTRLDRLAETGVTAIELMPLADFEGRRNWGYDGVLPFAPDSAYGLPDQLKHLIDEAHGCGLMVFLDVVYNHFGPSGNYLRQYAPGFFTRRHATPWGEAINFDGEGSRPVRDFFIHNALYWIEEYRVDGLRFDAVHAIRDDTRPDILVELAEAVRACCGPGRHIHLVLENDDNAARYLDRDGDNQPRHFTAQWNDDFHHAAHVLATGENAGYYADYRNEPAAALARGLAEGFVYQGEASEHRGGALRGEASAHLPPTAFVAFLQNHDQVGNRAFGERLAALADEPRWRALAAVLLLSPQIPLLFMGEEWASRRPFYYFCDFHGELAEAVREGRRREFARFPAFQDSAARERIPDPNAPETFAAAKLDWTEPERSANREALAFVRRLLALRHREIVPKLAGLPGGSGVYAVAGKGVFTVRWRLGNGAVLHLHANLSPHPAANLDWMVCGRRIHAEPDGITEEGRIGALPPWSVCFSLGNGKAQP